MSRNGASVDKSERRKWSQERNDIIMTPRRHERVPVAKQMEPSPGYDEYLLLLQQRNKMIQKVKLTDKEQLEKEKKEKGFTLYVNGANDGKKNGRRKAANPSPRGASNARVAADLSNLSRKTPSNAEDLSINIPSLNSRSRSAPEKAEKRFRKNWNASSVNIQTARGEKMHLHVPDLITGNYTEDFEDVTESINNNALVDSDTDDETIQESVNFKSAHKQPGDSASDDDTEEIISDHVLLSINDISKLRKSLELSRFVRESVSQDTDDGEEDSDLDEEISDVTNNDMIAAGDTLVLEFAPIKHPPIKTSLIPQPRSASTQSHIYRKIEHRNSKMRHSKTRSQASGKTIDLKPSQTPIKTPRPLSSVKRASVESKTESDLQRSEVLSALATENEQISEYRKKKQERSQPNPLVNSYMLNSDEGMRDVEDRVLQMEPKQQRQLIKTLYQLEQTVRPSSTAVATRQSKHLTAKSKDTEVHKIMLEFMSNWGHKSLVGLTEVMVLNECNQRIEVNTSFLRLDGAKKSVGCESNMFNNRYRTVKDRNMFCCEKSGQRPVSLSFRVEIPLGSQINKIKFWNYNKSLNELNIGVRRIRISIDDDIIYDGDIEKGCGNQVFDYGHTVVVGSDNPESEEEINHNTPVKKSLEKNTNNILSDTQKDSHKRLHHPDHSSVSKSSSRKSSEMWIPLTDTPEPMERSRTRILCRSTDGVEVPTVVSSDSENDEFETYNGVFAKHADSLKLARNAEAERNTVLKPPLPQNPSKVFINGANSKSNSMAKPVRNSTQTKLPWMDKGVDPMKSLSHRSGSPSRGANLNDGGESDNKEKKSKVLPDWLDKSKSDPLRSSLDDMLEALDMWKPIDDRKQAELKTIFDNQKTVPQPSDGIPTKVASEKEEAVYRESASKEMTKSKRSKPSDNSGASRRRKWQQPSVDLEASWTSLDMFAKSHKGRLSMEGDTLDEYLRSVGTPGTGVTVDGSTVPPSRTNQAHIPAAAAVPLHSISEEDPFIIPELPRGKNMVISIKSTWGDKYYVGLNGIELFGDNGEPISISKVTANPRDINVLPDYKNDPRVVSNLVDGVNRTRDDIHMWLAPFTEGANHFICLTFSEECHVALMRIWNYNKSRIHSYRGAKDVEISLDGTYIFKGEIARACGGMQGGTESFGDTILFTMSDEILDAVSRHDGQYEGGNFSDEWEDDVPYEARPATADKGNSGRPPTSVLMKNQSKPSVHHSISTQPLAASKQQLTDQKSVAVPVAVDGTTLVYKTKRITLNFTETWGDPHYLGLTGFEIVSKDGDAVPVTLNMLHAEPRDLHILPGYETDDRTLDKVIDGENITISDEHMWLIPYTEGTLHTLTITFSRPQEIVGLRFWNYNKSAEDTYRGAKTVHVLLDNSPISPPQGFLIRKGPGNCFYDFAQELLFSDILRHIQCDSQLSATISNNDTDGDESEDYVISGNMPKGFVYQFHLMSTHSDLYYIGLNAVEFYDSEGKKIELDENNLAAYPESVNVLDGIEGDIRTPDKLVNGINDTSNSDHMWLAPVLPGITNRLFIIFDYPQTISMIKIWNYSKTPSRGVKDFALLVDDLLVYNGALDSVRFGRGILPNSIGPQNFHTVLFTNDEKIKNKVKHTIVSNKSEELDVQLTNDNLVMSKPALSKLQKEADQALRPKTSVQKRPAGKRR